ncbi:hypothetical protein [Actinoallomurus soli]|nr:hypothetical protein [Actinoallomurus soli]MCO5975102.1 hypothetical protein [Actinoallomurus soli]
MVLEAERWLELRRFRALRDAGASISEIARETAFKKPGRGSPRSWG